ncbi:hypothetical protein LCGC14_1505580 [marine sediment metagenome]|uniref:Uncharacterized protein n=1 Tax=marine sediment metagenome TaxID=412755 RepID=A0A0F9J392_9ZZZZ
MPKDKYRRVVDRKMKDFGEIDYGKKKIRVNPKKGDLLNTIIHEELHRTKPSKNEKSITKETKKKESNLTVGAAIQWLNKYRGKRPRRVSEVVYQ